MSHRPANKHAERSAQTRARFIEAAQQLFAERSIDAVSLNEITVAAGQKNRNALQYHFGDRAGLLQAIIDSHAPRVHALRQAIIDTLEASDATPAEAAARALVQPLSGYVEENPAGIYYVKILSQMAVLNTAMLNPGGGSGFTFQRDERLIGLFARALSHLESQEIERRIFLSVSITFHGIADSCRTSEAYPEEEARHKRAALFEQVVLAVQGLAAAPPLPT